MQKSLEGSPVNFIGYKVAVCCVKYMPSSRLCTIHWPFGRMVAVSFEELSSNVVKITSCGVCIWVHTGKQSCYVWRKTSPMWGRTLTFAEFYRSTNEIDWKWRIFQSLRPFHAPSPSCHGVVSWESLCVDEWVGNILVSEFLSLQILALWAFVQFISLSMSGVTQFTYLFKCCL